MLEFFCGMAVGAGIITIIVAVVVELRGQKDAALTESILGSIVDERVARQKDVTRLEDEIVILGKRITLARQWTDICIDEHEIKFHAPKPEARPEAKPKKSPRKDPKPKK